MGENSSFSHTWIDSSDFTERCNSAGIVCSTENLAFGAISAEALLKMWQDSPSHNANMLGNYSYLGLARSGNYSTALFK